jgi:hypothetical protein
MPTNVFSDDFCGALYQILLVVACVTTMSPPAEQELGALLFWATSKYLYTGHSKLPIATTASSGRDRVDFGRAPVLTPR